MKTIAAFAPFLFALTSFATETTCTLMDQNGNGKVIYMNSIDLEGSVSTRLNGNTTLDSVFRIYIMNDSISGQYYYEGMSKIHSTTEKQKWFSLKLSSDNSNALFTLKPEMGSSTSDILKLNHCEVSGSPRPW